MKKLQLRYIFAILFGCLTYLHAQPPVLWGVTAGGGNGYGTIFSMTTGSTGLTSQYNLTGNPGSSPQLTKLLEATNGKLYGMTSTGGSSNFGVLFEYDTLLNVYTKRVDFTGAANGQSPQSALIQASDGNLYGMTKLGGANSQGVLFKFDITNNTYTKLVDLATATGSQPDGSLIEVSGKLYGMTRIGGANGQGTIFEYNLSNSTYTKLIDLATATGSQPHGTLIRAANTKLYGITQLGGANSAGALFEYIIGSNTYTKKFDFATATGSSPFGSLMEASNGKLYGTTPSGGTNGVGVIFEYDIAGDAYTKLVDLASATGGNPQGSLIQATNGKLYGLARTGGANAAGALFEFDISGSVYTKKIDLIAATGSLPPGSLMQTSTGKLYGMTSAGGSNSNGVIFNYAIGTNTYTKRIDLNSSNGGQPNGSLVLAGNDKIYGLTSTGGANNLGIIFEYDFANLVNPYTKKIDLTSAGGSQPNGSLIEAPNGKLYGMTRLGGTNNVGTIFEYDYQNNIYTTKINFATGAGGNTPYGSLLKAANGKLYGLTNVGGANNVGVLFEYDYTNNSYTKKVDLSAANGANPFGSLIQAANNKLYGLTRNGGTNGLGVLFEYDIVGNSYTKKVDLSTANGSQAQGSLIEGTNGKLYGLTQTGGLNSVGVLFEYDITGNSYTKKFDFVSGSGTGPLGSLQRSANGNLYGMTQLGGANSLGVVFEYDYTNNIYTKKFDFSNVTGTGPLYTNFLEICRLPTLPSSIASFNALCQGTTGNQSFSISAIANATAYAWSFPIGASITSGSNTNVLGVDFSAVSSGIYTVGVNGVNICGNGTLSIKSTTVNALPNITVNSGSVCIGGSFTINPSGASSYTYSSGTNIVSPSINTNYSVTGASAEGCLSPTSAVSSVTVNALPVVTASATNSVICFGNTTTLNGGGANSYVWSGGVTNGSAFSPTITAAYTVTGTAAATGCTNTAVQSITVNALPAVTASATSSVICFGNSTTLNGGGASSYVWSGGVTNGVAFSPTLTAAYTVTGTAALTGCTNTAVQSITVNALPIVTASASNSVICFGGSTTLNGGGANTYAWSGGVTNGVSFSPALSAAYTVTGTAVTGCTNTAVQSITVNSLPAVTASASNSVICFGNTTTLNGGGANSYVWSGGVTNGVAFSPTITAAYTLTGTAIATGCTNTAVQGITVNALPLVTANATNSVICFGNSTTLSGGGASSYSWSGGIVDGVSFSPTITTTYIVTGTAAATGCTNTASRTITVNALPTVTASSTNPVICFGGTTSVNAGGASSYIWSNGLSNGVAFSPTTTLTYTVIGTSAATSCSNIAFQTVTVNALPTVTASATNPSICFGNTTTLNGSGASTYTWTGGAINGVPFSPTITTSYTLTGTSNAGCTSTNLAVQNVTVRPLPSISVTSGSICAGSSYTMIPSGASTYTFSNGSAVVSPTTNTSYSVNGTNSLGCVSASPAVSNITVVPRPIISISGNTNTICSGAILTLTASGAATYTWNIGSFSQTLSLIPFSSTIYSVTGTSANGCVSNPLNIAAYPITVNPLPTVTAVSGAICPGNSFVLSPVGALNYTFSSGSATVSPLSTSTYSIIGSDINGCVSANPAVATVSVVNTLTVSISGINTICLGETTSLTANGASNYLWSTGLISNTISATNTIAPSPTVSTTFTVIGSSGTCSDTTFIQINVNPLPTVSAITSASAICLGETATLTASGAASYTWTPQNSGTSITISPTVSSTYSVIGKDANGCSGSTTVAQLVNLCTGIGKTANNEQLISLYPNPNNGEFTIEVPQKSSLRIFDALGRVVLQQEVQEGKNAVLLNEQAKGIYFVELKQGNQTKTLKIIKQ